MFENRIIDFGNNFSVTFLATCIILGLFYYISILAKPKKSKLPHGPQGVPLVGNLLGMVKDPHLKLSEWAKQYGDLYTIRMAHRTALVVSDVKLLKELFGTMASTGKFKTETLLLISQGSRGILNTEGKLWLEQRLFCIKNLKELGYGQSSSMEPLILNEVNEVSNWIRKKLKKSNPDGIIDLNHVLQHATVNGLWNIVAGERFDLEDSQIGKLLKNWVAGMQRTMKTGLGFFPWLKYVAPKLSGYEEFDKACKDVHEFVEKKFISNKASFVEDKKRDLIDVYIEYMKKVNGDVNGQKSSFFGEEGWKNSVSSVAELFVAGGDVVTVSLLWAVIYLSNFVEAQEKLQTEIDQVIGQEKDPSLQDKLRMPYTEAVILETLRLSSLAIFGTPHELLDEISFSGYALPKGLILIANLYHIHHDPKLWGDPENFRPERFLDRDGARLKGYIVAFQPGKRQCPGEPLAKDTMFLFISKLFQQFNFRPCAGISKEEYLKPEVGIMLAPRISELVINCR